MPPSELEQLRLESHRALCYYAGSLKSSSFRGLPLLFFQALLDPRVDPLRVYEELSLHPAASKTPSICQDLLLSSSSALDVLSQSPSFESCRSPFPFPRASSLPPPWGCEAAGAHLSSTGQEFHEEQLSHQA